MKVNIVGAGISGAAFCAKFRELVPDAKFKFFEVRNHVAGNCYDEQYDGNWVQSYGPHIFHTESDKVMDFVSKFGEFVDYRHYVKSSVKDKLYTFPVNDITLQELGIKELDIEPHDNPTNAEEELLSRVGRTLYETFFRDYTIKQWGRHPKDLSPDITKRIPLKLGTTDPYYFKDKHQCMPTKGFTNLIENMISDAEIVYGDYQDYDYEDCDLLIVTSRVDQFFKFVHGELEYRYTRFSCTMGNKMDHPVINYPELHIKHTRATDFNKLYGKQSSGYICYEFPMGNGMLPTYPIESETAKLYREMSEHIPNVYFLGRLGTHRYLNMDQCVLEAIQLAEKIHDKLS